jgi:FkbM family methyltransferase
MNHHQTESNKPSATMFSFFYTRMSKFIRKRLIYANFNLREKEERKRSVIELERLFFDIVKTSSAELFLEVGAKDAEASRYIAKNQPHKEVIAFEANPYTFERFNNYYDYKKIGVDYRNTALSEQVGTVTINVRKNARGKPKADGQASLLKHSDYAPGHTQVKVDASTMDEVIRQNSNNGYALWMDVEGALEPVLKGARETLSDLQVSFIEVETKEIWSGQWVKSDVDSFLKSAGIIELARDFQSRWQCNVIYMSEQLSHSILVQQAFENYRKRIKTKDGKPQSLTRIFKNLALQSRTLNKVARKLTRR